MKIREWTEEAQGATSGPIDWFLIRQRAWEYFRTKVERNALFKLFGVVGKVRKLFTEIFGEEV